MKAVARGMFETSNPINAAADAKVAYHGNASSRSPLVLGPLGGKGVLTGLKMGIDVTMLEANAVMRSIMPRVFGREVR